MHVSMKGLLCFFVLMCLRSGMGADDPWIPQLQQGQKLYYGNQQYGYPDKDLKKEEYFEKEPIKKEEGNNEPCFYHDKDCIRQHLSVKSLCTPLYGPAKEPYIIKIQEIDIPSSNLTITIFNSEIKGLKSGKIKKFYIDKKTETLVLEVEFSSLVLDSQKSLATYYRKGKEPIEIADFAIIEYRDLSLTLTVRYREDHYRKSHVYAYVADSNPLIILGPEYSKEKKDVSIDFLKWQDDIGLTVREALVTLGPIYLEAYLQTQICNQKYYTNEEKL